MNRNEEINLYTVAAVRDFAETIQALVNRPTVLDEHAVGRAKDHLGCLAAHMETAIDLAGQPEKETPHRRMEVTLPNGTVAAITADPDISPETMYALTEMMRIVSDVHHIECLDCHATGPRVGEFYYDTKQEAIDSAADKWSERQMPR